jgi:hypothetical protein
MVSEKKEEPEESERKTHLRPYYLKKNLNFINKKFKIREMKDILDFELLGIKTELLGFNVFVGCGVTIMGVS